MRGEVKIPVLQIEMSRIGLQDNDFFYLELAGTLETKEELLRKRLGWYAKKRNNGNICFKWADNKDLPTKILIELLERDGWEINPHLLNKVKATNLTTPTKGFKFPKLK